MTAHSGKSYKQLTMGEMQGILKLLFEDRRRREEEFAVERVQNLRRKSTDGGGEV